MRALALGAVAALALARNLPAQTATGIKTGERQTGATRQCYYSAAGKEYTKTMQSYELCPVTIQVSLAPSQREYVAPAPASSQVTAHKTGEERTGSTKQCYYAAAGKRYTKTVQSYQLCPVSVNVR